MPWTADLAASIGADENALKLLIAQLFGYPVMMVHRSFLSTSSSTMQHLYFALTGILAGYWFVGLDVLHNLAVVVATYLIISLSSGSIVSVLSSLVFNFGYLLVGYWYTEMDGYLICWTMPHCVLCLRLMGLSWDCYDGARLNCGDGELSKDQQKSALTEKPSLLEMLSHSFFLGGYLIGPQFSMKKYRDFTTPGYIQQIPASPVLYSLNRLVLGFFYLFLLQVGVGYFPSDWPDTQDYYETSFLMKLVLLPIWVRVCLYKYLSLWLIGEGTCVLSGLSYNGLKENGEVDWTGCKNVNLIRLETASKFGHIIEGFNINTNQWSASYVYKRLKFMNNKYFSQGCTLMFLAIWHGYHVGYFLTFFNEFIVINFEKYWLGLLARSEWMDHPGANAVVKVIGWFYVFSFLPHCFIPFSLLTPTKFISSYHATYWVFYLFFLTLPLSMRLIRPIMRIKPKPKKED